MRKPSPEQAEWEQRTQGVSTIMVMMLPIFLIQLWLLTVALEEFMGGKSALAIPTTLASLACFLVNLRLLRYVNHLDRKEGKR